MEKIRFTVQILVLVLAFPAWFFAEMTMPGKAVKSVEVNNNDSIQVRKAAAMKSEKADDDLNLKTSGIDRLMVLSN